MSTSEVIDVMERLIREAYPDIDAGDAHVLATAAADVYLEHVDELAADARPQLLATVIKTVVDEYRR